MKTTMAVVLLTVVTVMGMAQPPSVQWMRTYGLNGDDRPYCVQQTTDGGYVVLGVSHSFNIYQWDYYLLRIDSVGDTLWTRRYRERGDQWGYCVQQTTDGGYILAGDGSDMSMIKIGINGEVEWARRHGGGRSILQTSDEGYIMAGTTYSAETFSDFYLVRTDSVGDTLWTREYGTNANEPAYCIKQTIDGGYILAGYSQPLGYSSDFYLIKTDSMGDTLWTNIIIGEYFEEAYSVLQTNDGGYIASGTAYSSPGYGVAFCAAKVTPGGELEWMRYYGGDGGERGYSICEAPDGNYVVAGGTNSFGAGWFDVYLVKINSAGDTLWTCTYGASTYEIANCIQTTSDGGYIIASEFYDSEHNILLIKTEPDTSRLPVGFIPGYHAPSKYGLQVPYPNPFNSSTTISYEVPVMERVYIALYNLLGRRVSTLQDHTVAAGVHEVVWNAGDLPSGIYFVRMQAGEFVQTRKVVLLK